MKHLQAFLSRTSKFGRLVSHISGPLYILHFNADIIYNIVPIKRLREQNEFPKDTQQILYVHKRLKGNKGHQQQIDGIRNKIKKKEEQEV